jgi:hypothetical protein
LVIAGRAGGFAPGRLGWGRFGFHELHLRVFVRTPVEAVATGAATVRDEAEHSQQAILKAMAFGLTDVAAAATGAMQLLLHASL